MNSQQLTEIFESSPAAYPSANVIDDYPASGSIVIEGHFDPVKLAGKIQAAALREAADELAVIRADPGAPWAFESGIRTAQARLRARADTLDPQ